MEGINDLHDLQTTLPHEQISMLNQSKVKNIAARQLKQQVSVITGDQHRRNNTAEFTIVHLSIHARLQRQVATNKGVEAVVCLSPDRLRGTSRYLW